jgi:hypothetical protein
LRIHGPRSPASVLLVDYGDYVGWAPSPPPGVFYGNPWESDESRHWHILRNQDFSEDNIRNYRIMTPEKGVLVGQNPVRQRTPEGIAIEKAAGKTVPEQNLQHETVKLPEKEIKKMKLPPQEDKQGEQQAPVFKKKFLFPAMNFINSEVKRKKSMERAHAKSVDGVDGQFLRELFYFSVWILCSSARILWTMGS